jgi:hypothetical protein
MDWQQVASLLVVAVTAVLLGRSEWRRRQLAKLRACGSNCGCSSSIALKQFKVQANQNLVQTRDAAPSA